MEKDPKLKNVRTERRKNQINKHDKKEKQTSGNNDEPILPK
jgi:hypothetical protein